MRSFALLLPTLLLGCYNPDRFLEERVQAECEWYNRCDILEIYGETLQDCVEEHTAAAETAEKLGETCDDFDAGAAKDCVETLQTSTCDGFEEGGVYDYPQACSEACPSSE